MLHRLTSILDSININKGYVNSIDYETNPLLKDLYKTISNKDFLSKGPSNDLVLKHTEFIIKWSYNLFLLHLLLLTLHVSNLLSDENHLDLKTDYRILEKELTSSLDATIRVKLRKQGVGITQNIYCGFDTEYKNKDALTNKLLSIQLALSTQTVLKLPFHTDYVFGTLNSQTSEFTPEKRGSSPDLNLELILGLTRDSIKIYRSHKYPNHDISLQHLITRLIESKTSYIKEKDKIVFLFPNTIIKEYFKRTFNNSYSMTELVTTSKTIVSSDLESSLSDLFTLLKNLYEESETTESSPTDSLEKLTSSGNLTTLPSLLDLDRKSVESLESVSHSPQSAPDSSDQPEPFDPLKLSRKRRTWMSSFSSSRVSVSVTPQMYLLIHNSAADLSILSDFDSFKDKLDLVNKCFVSLADPVEVAGMPIKIRDTQLLAPGGARSLKSLSELYKGIPKLSVSQSDIEDMEGY